ncbi:MAG: hypothetical protein LBC61_05505 [Candidatus Peribacteria bacterium]|nr:hypothetical protein [Candidatus Peribacteria bacterium]
MGNVPEILLKLIGLNHSDGVKINYNTLELLKNYSSERVNLLPLPIYDEE